MTVVLYSFDEELSSVSTNEWTDKLVVSGEVTEGQYKLFASCEFAGDTVGKIIAVRILLDNEEVSACSTLVAVPGMPQKFCDMGLATLTEGEHSMVLQYRSETLPNTTFIRRARILVEKH
jgi:hypothetical protein